MGPGDDDEDAEDMALEEIAQRMSRGRFSEHLPDEERNAIHIIIKGGGAAESEEDDDASNAPPGDVDHGGLHGMSSRKA